MSTHSNKAKDLIDQLPEDRRDAITKLRETTVKNLPEGFEESISNMIHFVVPFSLYPAGYHCPPKQPLPFLSIASQKNFIALYHMGIYADRELLEWFTAKYPKHAKYKLNMGKSCIRFKRTDDIPYELIGQLLQRISPRQWIDTYEKTIKR